MIRSRSFVKATRWSIIKTNINLWAISSPRIVRAYLPLCRLVEYPTTVNSLMVPAGSAVLEIGAGISPLAIYMADQGLRVCATDISVGRIQAYRGLLESKVQWKSWYEEGRISLSVQDARKLGLTRSFTSIVCISVIEHIPGEGDITAVEEMARVLSSGGRLALSFPFGDGYREAIAPYDTSAVHRIYDECAIDLRLVQPSDLQKERLIYFGWKSLFALHAWAGLCKMLNRRVSHHFIDCMTLFLPNVFYGTMSTAKDGLAEGAILILRKH